MELGRLITLELRSSVRPLIRAPGFSLVAIAIFAIGIGAALTGFSVLNGVVLSPLSYPEPDRLTVLTEILHGKGSDSEVGVNPPDSIAFTAHLHSFAASGTWLTESVALEGAEQPRGIQAVRMTAGVFQALGVQPLVGRTFTTEEDREGRSVAVLSYHLWKSSFSDAHIPGAVIRLDRRPYEVLGVMPPGFDFPVSSGHSFGSDLWIPMSFSHDEILNGGGMFGYQWVGRLKPGVTLAQAAADARHEVHNLTSTHLASMGQVQVTSRIIPLRRFFVSGARPLVRTLALAAIGVFLIAAVNFCALLLLRAVDRNSQLRLRLALGASRSRVALGLIVEPLLLSLAGGTVGLTMAWFSIPFVVRQLPENIPRLSNIGIGTGIALLALGSCVVIGTTSGVISALLGPQVSDGPLQFGRFAGTLPRIHAVTRSGFVIGQVALALILVMASGLLLRSFRAMLTVHLGFNPEYVVSAYYSLPASDYARQTSIDNFTATLLDRLKRLPGAEAVAITTQLPASGSMNRRAFTCDNPTGAEVDSLNVSWPSAVLGEAFSALGIRLLAGRPIRERDTTTSPLVAVVSKGVAEHCWPGLNSLGRRIHWGTAKVPAPWMTIVGEVEDVRQGRPDEPARLQIYVPSAQSVADFGSLAVSSDRSGTQGYIVLRSALSTREAEDELSSVVRSLDPELPLTEVRSLELAISATEKPRRFYTLAVSIFAGVALLLALSGVYVMVSFSAVLRRSEIAIRIALGSTPRRIFLLITRYGVRLALMGCAIGLLCGLGLNRLLRSMLFGANTSDADVLIVAPLVILVVAAIASIPPAVRAARTDPLQILRSE